MNNIKESLYSGADILVNTLKEIGVDSIFGYPGESTLPIAKSLDKFNVNHYISACERCSGYAADSYARYSGKVAICYAPGGIGSTLLMPAVSECYNSSIPVVFITISEKINNIGRWSTSTFNHESYRYCCKDVVRVETVQKLKFHLLNAIKMAASLRTGPCLIDIPYDVLVDKYDFTNNKSIYREAYISDLIKYPNTRIHASSDDIMDVIKMLNSAQYPIAILGGGVQLSQVPSELISNFVLLFDLKVATTLNGKGTVDERLNFAIGVVGQKGNEEANNQILDADLVLIIGSKYGDKTSMNWSLIPNNIPVIQIDVDNQEIGKSLFIVKGILSDAKCFFEDIITLYKEKGFVKEKSIRNSTKRLASDNIKVQKNIINDLMKILSKKMGTEDVIIADASQACGWMGAKFTSKMKPRATSTPRGTGSIGYALPASVGAAIARRNSMIVGIGGDAGFQMSMHDMETCKRLKLNIKFFLLDNNKLGLLENHLKSDGGNSLVSKERIAWDKISESFGWKYFIVSINEQLESVVEQAFSTKGPVLIDVIDNENFSPDFVNAIKIKEK